jgi:hypothetical protein
VTLAVLMMTGGLTAEQPVSAQVEENLRPSQSQGSNNGNGNNPGINTTQSNLTVPSSLVSTYRDSIGDLHIVGQVQNNFTFPINFVQITATIYDSTQQVIGTGNTYTDIDVLKSLILAAGTAVLLLAPPPTTH